MKSRSMTYLKLAESYKTMNRPDPAGSNLISVLIKMNDVNNVIYNNFK